MGPGTDRRRWDHDIQQCWDPGCYYCLVADEPPMPPVAYPEDYTPEELAEKLGCSIELAQLTIDFAASQKRKQTP